MFKPDLALAFSVPQPKNILSSCSNELLFSSNGLQAADCPYHSKHLIPLARQKLPLNSGSLPFSMIIQKYFPNSCCAAAPAKTWLFKAFLHNLAKEPVHVCGTYA